MASFFFFGGWGMGVVLAYRENATAGFEVQRSECRYIFYPPFFPPRRRADESNILFAPRFFLDDALSHSAHSAVPVFGKKKRLGQVGRRSSADNEQVLRWRTLHCCMYRCVPLKTYTHSTNSHIHTFG